MTIQNEALNWHFLAGSTGDGREIVRITPEVAHWGYSGLRVLDLAAEYTDGFKGAALPDAANGDGEQADGLKSRAGWFQAESPES